jgi:glycosyltransferase involved in cell wall biosynthesis
MEEVLFAKKGANSKKIETPLVSIILPAYNESAIITNNVEEICFYMETSEYAGKWELIIVNDGSKDSTGKIADEISKNRKQVRVFHHPVNLNLGNALKTGFCHSRGKYVITLDIDLSYSVNHIQLLLDTITTTHSDVVLVSPYMKGGKTTAVPFFRRTMSRWVNWLMSLSSQEKYHTFTCMVRAYKGDFIRSLNLKTRDYEINPEIIYKSMILRAKIIEIPGHLDWTNQKKLGKRRVSGMKIYKGILSGLMSSFIFRPYIYYLAISTFVFSIFLYLITWIFINISSVYPQMSSGVYFDDRFSYAVKIVFEARPHAFLIAGIALLVSLQFLSMGFLSLQNKRYFEELFHISSAIKDKA